ncbi:MAG: Stp1/IreP family PP2C-type Ser/Thr phosphatase [Fimbriimonadaceae bacterium]
MNQEDITAEFEQDEVRAPAQLKIWPQVTVAGKTDLGRVRENNEDKYEFLCPEDEQTLATRGQVFVVCDGMGGHEAGQIASELACKTFIDVYLNHPSADPATAARSAVEAANRFVLDVGRTVPNRQGMGTTLSALLIIESRYLVVQVGDSRVYRVREGEIEQLTVDHTWVEETVRAGTLSREDAENHPYQHVITRAVGTDTKVTPDVFEGELQAGDIYLLCSDGLTNHVSDAQLREELTERGPGQAAWNLVGKALVDGGSDNTTCLVVRIDSLKNVGETEADPAL